VGSPFRGVALILVALCGCTAVIPTPLPRDVGAAQAEWPGTTQADLDRGRAIYVNRCGNCHLLHAPNERAPAQWPAVVAKMAPRAKLSPTEHADVARYLVVLAAAPPRD